jgi:hypothetical protein
LATTTTTAAVRIRSRALGLALVWLVAGCGDTTPDQGASAPSSTSAPTTAAPGPVDGIVATVDVNRLFALERAHGLGLRNVGDEVRTVVAVGLESPLYGDAPLDEREVVLRPGARQLVMPAPYGQPRCDGDPEAAFTAVVRFADGTELRIPAAQPHASTLARLHAKECAAAAVQEAVELRADDWVRDGDAARGTLAVVAVGGGGVEAEVTELAGNVIFSLRTVDGATLHLREGDEETEVEVVIRAERCDQHALAEVKRPFVFGAWVALDGAGPALVELHPTGPALAAVQEIFATCGDAG